MYKKAESLSTVKKFYMENFLKAEITTTSKCAALAMQRTMAIECKILFTVNVRLLV